ncbi:MAG: hypothetical protein MZV64_48205 [Ignavibacteriales bacterium]|nr:hypothetical protein [Ignavibacteriales bacterium]
MIFHILSLHIRIQILNPLNINTSDSTFEGSVTLYVNNLDHLNRIIERLKKSCRCFFC